MKYGLLGKTLGHSWSQKIHAMLGNPSYELFERNEDELAALFSREDIGGLNVTIPYKKTVLPYLSSISPAAEKIGCVNTVVFGTDGSRVGHNTDYDGLTGTVDRMKIDLSGKRVLILGTGATSQTAYTVCADRGADVRKLGRAELPPKGSDLEAAVLINCTPVGMYPNNGETLADPAAFHKLEAVIDLVYNPHRTRLLLKAAECGIPHADGLYMLVRQAAAASEYFLRSTTDTETEERILRTIRLETDNVVLIGMPGSGKSTVGALLAKRLHKKFVDLDERIEAAVGMPVPDYITAFGEEAFREAEVKVTQKAGKEHGQVIATGGGVVTRKENYASLAQNGRIYCLQRDPEALATGGRPLSAGGAAALRALYEQRAPMYRAFADLMVEQGTVAETVTRIEEDFHAHCHH